MVKCNGVWQNEGNNDDDDDAGFHECEHRTCEQHMRVGDSTVKHWAAAVVQSQEKTLKGVDKADVTPHGEVCVCVKCMKRCLFAVDTRLLHHPEPFITRLGVYDAFRVEYPTVGTAMEKNTPLINKFLVSLRHVKEVSQTMGRPPKVV